MIEAEGWIVTPWLRPDHGGPQTRPYVPMPGPEAMEPLCEALQAVARAQPHRPAVEAEDGTVLTFGDLWSAVARQAARLEALAPGPVGVLAASGAADVVAVFAALAAGRVAVMMDAHAPDARNADLLAATGASLAPGGPKGADVGATRGAGDLADGQASAPPPAARFGLDDPAFILPTSGSTGRPKLIAHSQRTMFHWARTTHNALHVQPDDRVLSLSSSSTLGGFTALLSVPLAGACVQAFDIRSAGLSALMDVLARRTVTILRAAPSMLRGLARLPGAAKSFSGLRLVQTYGEPLMREDVGVLKGVLPPGGLIRTTYGSTECSGLSWFASDEDGVGGPRMPTGALMPDTQARLLDDDDAACGAGREGELVIRSAYNALGEWEDGGLVPGRLTPDPADPSKRIYRTGDLAMVDGRGVFTVLGRKDRMVKINGQRLEPAEIERVLQEDEGVARAAVVLDTGVSPARIIAFVCPSAGRPAPSPAALAAQVRARLPSFMVPSKILPVADVPLLASGKVDGLALMALAEDASR